MENQEMIRLRKDLKNLTLIGTSTDLLDCKPIAIQIKEHSINPVKNYLKGAISKCLIQLTINVDQSFVDTLAEDLIDKYKYESIEDLVYCLKKGRQGFYGNNYNKVNMIVISEWMYKHLEDKAESRERQIKQRYQTSKNPLDVVDYEKFKQRIQDKKPSIAKPDRDTLNEYILKTCEALDVKLDELLSRSKERRVTDARGLVKHFQQEKLKMTREQIKKYWECLPS